MVFLFSTDIFSKVVRLGVLAEIVLHIYNHLAS
jgi:hypothetical protein